MPAGRLLVHFLFASWVTKQGTLSVITSSLEGTDIGLPNDSDAVKALAQNELRDEPAARAVSIGVPARLSLVLNTLSGASR